LYYINIVTNNIYINKIKEKNMEYIPKRVLFEKKSLDYPLGEKIYKQFSAMGIETIILKSNRVTGIPGDTHLKKWVEGKKTLVVKVRKKTDFQTCKPSAHYQLPLASGCSGKCEYCYLNTRFGKKPYITIYVNIEDIFDEMKEHMKERLPYVTIFEAASTSDPIPLERYTGSLAKTIEFVGNEEKARLRFVTKFAEVESLLNLNHNGHTTIRFSINAHSVIRNYEHGTASLKERIDASKKVKAAGYNLGYIIGPVIMFPGWEKEYMEMMESVRKKLGDELIDGITFEVISHRFTSTAKDRILEVFPESTLPMNTDERQYKYGQFGYGKYVYKKDDMAEIEQFFKDNIKELFPKTRISYII